MIPFIRQPYQSHSTLRSLPPTRNQISLTGWLHKYPSPQLLLLEWKPIGTGPMLLDDNVPAEPNAGITGETPSPDHPSAINDDVTQFATALARKKAGNTLEAIQQFSPLAEHESLLSGKANYQLGKIFQQGLGVEKNEEKAAQYYKKAFAIFSLFAQGTDKQAAEANYHLGKMHQQGLGVTSNQKSAEQCYRKAKKISSAKACTQLAKLSDKENDRKTKSNYEMAIFQSPGKGSAKAHAGIAGLYQEGRGTKQNIDKAITHYKEAIGRGTVNAHIDLGNLYRDKNNYQQAFTHYQQGAGPIAAQACLELGDLCGIAAQACLEVGDSYGQAMNFKQAALCYQEAQRKGSDHAWIKLGDLSCVTKNLDQALEDYKKAKGNLAANSFEYLGHLFRENNESEKAAQCYELAAKNGCAKALLHLGDLYKAQDMPGNREKAFQCYEQAEQQGLADACIYLGNHYLEDKNYQEAFQCYQRGEGKNAAQGCLKVGRIFEEKRNVPQAILCYKAAEKKGSAEAANHLGCICVNSQEYEEAASYFVKAKASFAEAACNLGLLHVRKQLSRTPDYAAAMTCFEEAVRNGFAKANAYIGYLYYNSSGVPKDLQKALDYFNKGAKAASPSAYAYLGKFYEEGSEVRQDFAKAIYWYEQAINLKHSSSATMIETIAKIKANNPGLKNQQYQEAFDKYYPLAEEGNAEAQYQLGIMYLHKGDFYVKQSDTNAEHYLAKAWENRHPQAAYELGVSYETRTNLRTKSTTTAAIWYSRACDSSDPDIAFKAAEKLVAIGGKEGQIKALKVFMKAAENGNNEASKHLGDMYYCGLGVEKNIETAKIYYRQFLGNNSGEVLISRRTFVLNPGLGDQEVSIQS